MEQLTEDELVTWLQAMAQSEYARNMEKFLQLRRERFRDSLESFENSEIRGRAKECKELLQLFH